MEEDIQAGSIDLEEDCRHGRHPQKPTWGEMEEVDEVVKVNSFLEINFR